MPPDAGSPLPEPRPSVVEATTDSTIHGTVEHLGETAEEHSEE
jgi:hypothetical protein